MAAVSATTPLRTVWDALERFGCWPHGKPHDFYSRCPAHYGESTSALHVCAGADGRVVLWCFARQCFAEDIVAPLGLTMCDLFPAGHRHAYRRRLAQARRADFHGNARTLVNALKAFEDLGLPWQRAELVGDCPYCGYPNARLVVPGNPDHKPFVHCEGACTARAFTEALAGLIHDQKENQ